MKKLLLIVPAMYLIGCVATPPSSPLTDVFTNKWDGSLPKLDDPQLQSLQDDLQVEFKQYMANPNTYFSRPNEVNTWPCTLSPSQLNKLTGTVDSDNDPVMKRRLVNDSRSNGGLKIKITYSNQQTIPVKASCKNGLLDGPVEFWQEVTMHNDSPMTKIADYLTTQEIQNHLIKRIWFNAQKGNSIGPIVVSTKALDSTITYSDPTLNAQAKLRPKPTSSVSFSKSSGEEPSSSVSISHVVVNGDTTVNVTTERLFGDHRREETTYWNNQMLYRKLYKNDKLHGVTTLTGQPNECWEEGEKVLTASCVMN